MQLSTRQRVARGVLVGALLAGFLYVFQLNTDSGDGYVCPLYALTGLECFSCGLSRSLHAVLHGQFPVAFQFHALGPLLVVVAFTATVVWLSEAVTGKSLVRFGGSTLERTIVFGVGTCWVLFGAIRLVLEILSRSIQ